MALACQAQQRDRAKAVAQRDRSRSRVAPGMGTEPEVKVLLRPRQKELNTESKGDIARCRLVEAVGAARTRAKAKHRKAREPWVSLPLEAKPEICWSAACIGDGFERSAMSLTRGELSASHAKAWVTTKDARTRW